MYIYICIYINILIYIKKNKGIARKKNLYKNDGWSLKEWRIGLYILESSPNWIVIKQLYRNSCYLIFSSYIRFWIRLRWWLTIWYINNYNIIYFFQMNNRISYSSRLNNNLGLLLMKILQNNLMILTLNNLCELYNF